MNDRNSWSVPPVVLGILTCALLCPLVDGAALAQSRRPVVGIKTPFAQRKLFSEAAKNEVLADDTDKDGLADEQEAIIGTDPRDADTDDDALLDGWEVFTVNGLDLKALGASPLHKDIFIEMDYMRRDSAANGLGPNENVLTMLVELFATALVDNPDKMRGIALHLELGNEVPHDADLNPVVAEFANIKARNFAAERAPVYRYMLWADQYNGGTSSGLAFAIPNSEFIVTLGGWEQGAGGTDLQKLGIFMHELGHTLGLWHGSTENLNYKPNHLSVMNYSFATVGVRWGEERKFDFQRIAIPALDEAQLFEANGLGKANDLAGYYTRVRRGNGESAEVPAHDTLDLDGDGQINSQSTRFDINGDAQFGPLQATPNEWQRLIYNGGTIGSTARPEAILRKLDAARRLPPFEELTEEQDQALRRGLR